KLRLARDSNERGAGKFLPPLFQRAPGAEGDGQPRRDLRVFLLYAQDGLGHEAIAFPIGPMEAGLIVRRECTDERAYAVRIGEREGLVVHQAAYEIDGPGAGDGCLYDEPFVEH